jgi:hypothetical protein
VPDNKVVPAIKFIVIIVLIANSLFMEVAKLLWIPKNRKQNKKSGVSSRIRTCDRPLRRRELYPAELWTLSVRTMRDEMKRFKKFKKFL